MTVGDVMLHRLEKFYLKQWCNAATANQSKDTEGHVIRHLWDAVHKTKEKCNVTLGDFTIWNDKEIKESILENANIYVLNTALIIHIETFSPELTVARQNNFINPFILIST